MVKLVKEVDGYLKRLLTEDTLLALIHSKECGDMTILSPQKICQYTSLVVH